MDEVFLLLEFRFYFFSLITLFSKKQKDMDNVHHIIQ